MGLGIEKNSTPTYVGVFDVYVIAHIVAEKTGENSRLSAEHFQLTASTTQRFAVRKVLCV